MKILVVGGAGYIGSHVVKALLKENFEVTVYDNLSSGLQQNLQSGADFVQGDILDSEFLNKTVKEGGFVGAVHLAAFKAAGESMTLPEKYSTNNISGAINLLNALSFNDVKNLVFSSSAAVYGSPKYLPIDENHPKAPENYYGYTKLAIEDFFSWYEKLKGMRFGSLRYFNAAGYDIEGELTGLEANPANLLPVVMEVATGRREKMQLFGTDYETRDGTCIRDYVHVTDLARAHVQALQYMLKEDKSITVNLGSETGVTVQEMISAAEEITGKKLNVERVDRREGDPGELVATSTKAKELLGWEAKHSDVKTLLKTTYDAYLANK
jgi:UDP-glucose 4-epimerase